MKMKLSKGFAGRLTGGLVGGAASAVFDRYVLPMLGDTVSQYANYVKIGVGAALPALVKNNSMIDAVGDSLIAIGAGNVVGGLLDGTTTDNGSGDGVSGVTYVNGGNFPNYRAYVTGAASGVKKKKKEKAAAANAVSAVR